MISFLTNNTQEFTFTGELLPLHYMAHIVDSQTINDVSYYVEKVTGKAAEDQ